MLENSYEDKSMTISKTDAMVLVNNHKENSTNIHLQLTDKPIFFTSRENDAKEQSMVKCSNNIVNPGNEKETDDTLFVRPENALMERNLTGNVKGRPEVSANPVNNSERIDNIEIRANNAFADRNLS